MSLKRCLTITICTLLFIYRSQAQIPVKPSNVQSPNVSSLGMYGEFPVSLYTGIPNITLSLYDLLEKSTSVPINLSYHASGFRPDVHPGWVGGGFSLSCGGVISRIVKDKPDEFDMDIAGLPQLKNSGYYYNHNILNDLSWNQIGKMQNIARTVESDKDTEPDEFSFNFGNYCGNFYLNSDGKWKVRCNKPISIEIISPFLDKPFTKIPFNSFITKYGNPKSFGGFVLTVENGTKYYFGGNTNAIEYSIGFFEQTTDYWTAGSWYLTKIVTPTDDSTEFTYERGDYINQMYLSLYSVKEMRLKGTNGVFSPFKCSSTSYPRINESYSGKLVDPVYLKQITGSQAVIKFDISTSTELRYGNDIYKYKYDNWLFYINQSLAFNPASTAAAEEFLPFATKGFASISLNVSELQWKKLDKIRIENKKGILIKAFNFAYTNNDTERLRLLSVTEIDGKLKEKNPYLFDYDKSVVLPGYLANKTDHWGFYNGKYADVNDKNNYYNTYYGYREPDVKYLFAGILNKIVYPTGGVTEFAYEPNRYSKVLKEVRGGGIDNTIPQQNYLAGGLRIKKITSYDLSTSNPKMEKEYFYVNGFGIGVNQNTLSSSGVLSAKSKYYFDDYSRKSFNTNAIYSKSIFSSQSILPGSYNSGSHIGYSEVVEKNGNAGYSIFKFSNYDNGYNDEDADNLLQPSRTQYEPYSSNEQSRGNLLFEYNYRNDGSLAHSKNIDYIALNKVIEYVPSLKAGGESIDCGDAIVNLEEGAAYRLYTYTFLPSEEIDIEYDSLGQKLTERSMKFEYASNKLLAKQTTLTSDDKRIVTAYKYPKDFFSGVYPEMVSKNIVSPVIEQTVTKDDRQTFFTRTNYDKFNTSLLLPKSIEIQVGANPIETKQIFNRYDLKGNILEQQQPYGIKESYVWGYNGQHMLAKIVGLDYISAIQGVEKGLLDDQNSSEDQIRIELNKMRSRLPNSQVVTYTYEPLVGMKSQTDQKGQTIYYDYDDFQRLKNIKDQNNNIVENYTYNTRPKVYYSTELSRKFYKKLCGTGFYGSEETYVVPAGRYISAISQSEADLQAQNEIYQNGQDYANQQGACMLEGTYVFLCNKGVREAINGNYKEIYLSYFIKVNKDAKGHFVKQSPVNVQYRYHNGPINTLSVLGSQDLGEYLVEREYIGPISSSSPNDPPNVGELISYTLELVNNPNYNISQVGECDSEAIEEEDVEDSSLQQGQDNNMVHFENLSSLCGYTADLDVDIVSLYYYNDPQTVVKCFSDSTMQYPVVDGYYTFFKTTNNGSNKWYKIEQGVIIEQGICQ